MHPKKQTLLWRIHSGQNEFKGYLFGTMHVRDEAAFKHVVFLEKKILACNAFAAEFHLDEGAKQSNNNLAFLPNQTILSDYLPEKAFQKIKQSIQKSFTVDLQLFQRIQPLFITNILTEQVLSNDRPVPLDESLWQFAKAQQKELLGIETWEEQQKTLSQLDIPYQIKNLKAIARKPVRFKKGLHKSLDHYLKGNIKQLYRSAYKSAGEKRKVLLFNRNKVMTERIKQIVNQRSLFAAVGAGHLFGEKGIIRLLKQEGFRVKPILMEVQK